MSRTHLRTRLRLLLEDPTFREALFIASPDLDKALAHWLASPDSEKGQRAERAVVRYFARMCGRSTPFGLFAGCSVGRVADATDLRIGGKSQYIRHTRLDMDYLCALSEALAREPALRRDLRFRPNSSLYAAGGRLRYAEVRTKDKARSYHLVAVEETPYLLDTLTRARDGASLRTLAEALVDEEITLEEAESYIHELIENQILLPELQPAVTGPEPIHDLIAQLEQLPEGAFAARTLDAARQALKDMDAAPLGLSQDRYLRIASSLQALPTKVELNRLFQTDLVKPSPEAVLGPEVMTELQRGVVLLHRLFGTRGRDPLSAFKDAFQARYEEREIPLVEALDEESGVGFDTSQSPGSEGSPLLEGLAFPARESESTAPWSPRDTFLLRKVVETLAAGGRVLRLEEEELKAFEHRQPLPLPESFSVMARLAAASAQDVAKGNFKLAISGVSGPSGAHLLGRFCHGDPQLTREVMAYLAAEEARQPEALHAEIVHLPEGRIGNVILRPLLRGYEIPFLGRSGAPEETQIPVTDLLVSVRGGRITLRSRRLGREVLPRLTNAHNFSFRSLGIYRFLCMLQHQGLSSGLGWSWGILERLPFLPRVEVGRLVLAKARWHVEGKDWRALLEATGDQRWSLLQAQRAGLGLPRLVLLSDGDNKLPVDLANPLSVEAFLDLVKKRPHFILEEFYPGPEDLCAEGPEGRFVHEVVVPFTKGGERANPPVDPRSQAIALPRRFQPGSEWLYAKLYAGHAGVDQLLREGVSPLVKEVMASGAADGWFFIRYGDSDWHLRLRFHGDPGRLATEVLPRLESISGRLARRLVVDTYEREMERYGGDEGMEPSERMFQADSEAVVGILKAYTGDTAADARWRLCLKGMDLVLESLGFELEARFHLAHGLRTSFLKEFRGEGPFERQLGDRFRRDRAPLEALLDPPRENQGPLAEGVAILRRRSEAWHTATHALRRLAAEGRLTVPLESLAGSFLHMHANRLLRASARAQELVLYDFLARFYDSRLARERKSLARASSA